jgi:hypothetical protein
MPKPSEEVHPRGSTAADDLTQNAVCSQVNRKPPWGVNRLRLRRNAESVKTNRMRTGHENGVTPIPRSN